VVWRIKTGDWVCLNDWFTLYYLRFAAQAYYNRVLYISDVVVPGGITEYPWLPFVPAIYVARVLNAGPFAVNLIWILLSAIGLSTGWYWVFRHLLQRPWAAAGCTMFCLSDYGFAAARPLTTQLRMLASALWFHPTGLVVIPWGLLLQWRVPDPALYLPFLCFQILAVARARERPTLLNLGLSGIAFGLLFFVFFYCWTMALAGLGIAFVLDRGARKVYGATLCIGGVVGLPQLAYSIYVDRPPRSMRRSVFFAAPRFDQVTVPALAPSWPWRRDAWRIWKSKDLTWSTYEPLRRRNPAERRVVGIFSRIYYDWLWTPIRMALH
jgi:hypothetical protein